MMGLRTIKLNFNGEDIFSVSLPTNDFSDSLSKTISRMFYEFEDYKSGSTHLESSGNPVMVKKKINYLNMVNNDIVVFTDTIVNEFVEPGQCTLDGLLARTALKKALTKIYSHDQFSEATFNQLIGK